MRFVLIHLGGAPPTYSKICVDQIRKYFDGAVHFHGLNPGMDAGIENSDRVREFESVCKAGGYDWSGAHGNLWNYSFKRLFVLEEIIRHYKMEDVIHIENDVLIYDNPENMNFEIFKFFDKVAINVIGEKYATYAYTYIPSLSAIKKMNDANLAYLSRGHSSLMSRYKDMVVNEMLVARDLVRDSTVMYLPTMPDEMIHKNHNILFDGASWGQHLMGTPNDPPGWAENRHYAGKAINDGLYKTAWRSGPNGKYPIVIECPKMSSDDVAMIPGREYKLVNLHVHSKKLADGI